MFHSSLACLLKYGGTELIKRIQQIVQIICIEEKMPEEWNQGILCPILKKRGSFNL
jgi:hypothetical protein